MSNQTIPQDVIQLIQSIGLIVFFVTLVLLCFVLMFRKHKKDAEEIRNEKVNYDDNVINAFLRTLALEKTKGNKFEEEIYTQNGDYRLDFLKEVHQTENYFKQQYTKYKAPFETHLELNNIVSNSKIKIIDIDQLPLLFDSKLAEWDNNTVNTSNNTTNVTQNSFISVHEFFVRRQNITNDVVGVYVLHNITKDKYYVGQATKIYNRVNQHFTGNGNGDVYVDYSCGDDFEIEIVKLKDTNYEDLDLFEKDYIQKYNAYTQGYNKTRGNG